MFERIIVNRQSLSGAPLDLGFLAECLVFYSKVNVVTDAESFRFLVRCCGPDELLELHSMGRLEIEFFDNNTAITTTQSGTGPLHDICRFTSNPTRYQQVSRKLFDELSGSSGRGANRLFTRFERAVRRSNYTDEMVKAAQSDLADKSYMASAARSLLSYLAPEYPAPPSTVFEVRPEIGDGRYRVSTNIDFEAANVSYHRHVPWEHSSLSAAYLLINVVDARRDLSVGCREESEFALGPARAVVLACKFGEILSQACPGAEVQDLFQEAVVENLPKIREVVNSGERTFRDVVRLAEKGQKFRDWLSKRGSDEDLRSAYCQEVSRVDWADKLPCKSLRWLVITALTTGLGFLGGPVAGTAAATTLSAADFFLLDKLLKGWKPSQFIEGPLREFLSTRPQQGHGSVFIPSVTSAHDTSPIK